MKQTLTINDENEMMALGAALAAHLPHAAVVALQGELGAGKTTLVRGLVRALGWNGVVRSPTYALMEYYEFSHRGVCHVDLYRLAAADEIEMLGLRDYLNDETLLLIEWPERAQGALPVPHLHCMIDSSTDRRQVILDSKLPAVIAAVAAFKQQK